MTIDEVILKLSILRDEYGKNIKVGIQSDESYFFNIFEIAHTFYEEGDNENLGDTFIGLFLK